MPLPLRSIANGLTVSRAVAGLPLILALQFDHQALAWWLLLLAGLSDAADGWLARRSGGGSSWGARLDPLTDKVLIAAPLLWLASSGTLPLWAVWLLLARELLLWPPGWIGGRAMLTLGWWLFWPSLLMALSSAVAYLRIRSGFHQH